MSNKQGFFSRQDIGGEDAEKFRLSLQVANLKIINAELLEALEECEEYFDNKADYRGMDEEGRLEPDNEMKMLIIVRNAIQKAKNG